MPTASTGRTDYNDVQVAAVLSVTWAGRTWYLATRSLTGSKWSADPGLVEEPPITDDISLEPGGDVGASFPVAFCLPAVRVEDVLGAGYDLEDIAVELAVVWHRDGQLVHEWAAREVRAVGYAIEAVHDDPEQPAGYIACTVEDSPYRTERPLARYTWAVTPETWPDSPEHGTRYPWVIGRPAGEGQTEGPPAPVVTQVSGTPPTNDEAVVSIGWSLASQVTVYDTSGNSAVLAIDYQEDGLGQLCALVTVAGSALDDTDGVTYTTAWTEGPALTPYGDSDPLSIAAYLLAIGGADIDIPAWISSSRLLDLEMGGYIDDPDSRAWEVARNLLSGLPVTMRRARDGWAPVLLDPYLAKQVCSTTWDEDGPYRRVSWAGATVSRVARVEGSPMCRTSVSARRRLAMQRCRMPGCVILTAYRRSGCRPHGAGRLRPATAWRRGLRGSARWAGRQQPTKCPHPSVACRLANGSSSAPTRPTPSSSVAALLTACGTTPSRARGRGRPRHQSPTALLFAQD